MTAVTAEQLAEWRALAAAATEGPWLAHPAMADQPAEISAPNFNGMHEPMLDLLSTEDAAFIAAARTAVPALVAEVERLREESVKALAVVKLATDAMRMHEIGIKRSGDVTGEEHMEYLALERSGLTFEIARGIVAALRARAALPEEPADG